MNRIERAAEDADAPRMRRAGVRSRGRVRRPRVGRERAATSLRAARARPSPVTPRCGRTAARAAAARAASAATPASARRSTASILFAATSCGLAASVRLKQLAARAGRCRDPRPDRGRSRRETSTRCTSTFVRSRWRRNWWPSPWPRCAPSISPGTSATTKLRSSLRRDDAEVRRQRRERVVGDLRPRRRDARDQRRLAGVREADQADVGEQLQLEPQVLVFAGLARLHLARRAVGGRREPRVAHAAAAAAGDEHALAFLARDRRAAAAARPASPVFS